MLILEVLFFKNKVILGIYHIKEECLVTEKLRRLEKQSSYMKKLNFKFFVLLKKGCHEVWDISLLQTATLINRRWMSNS